MLKMHLRILAVLGSDPDIDNTFLIYEIFNNYNYTLYLPQSMRSRLS